MQKIPFNRPYLSGREHEEMNSALATGKHCGNGPKSKEAESWLQRHYGLGRAFLVPSGTAALEMAAVVADVKAGDEFILPSYTFSSTANAFCIRGAKPIFAEVDPDTLVMDVRDVANKISKKTKAIVPINYGGVSPDLDGLLELSKQSGSWLIEDAAQGVDAKYKGRFVGSVAPLSTYSFHETKNISCGEGGAFILNEKSLEALAEFAQEKGTDRSQVIAGLKSKYGWVSLGSSYLLAEPLAAMLLAQLNDREQIRSGRARAFKAYQELFGHFESKGYVRTQKIPSYCETNYHGYYLIFEKPEQRDDFIAKMSRAGVSCYIGYLALHTSQMGQTSYGGRQGQLPITEKLEKTIVRLPLFASMTDQEISTCIERMGDYFRAEFGS